MNSPNPETDISSWSDAEVKELLQFLIKAKATLSYNGQCFKKKTYVSAASTIGNKSKTPAEIRSKWKNLKKTYRSIERYRAESSGFHWDTPQSEEDIGLGANIVTPSEAVVWEATMKSSKWAKPLTKFRNRGWPWLWYMQQILPVAGTPGAYAFSPSQSHPAVPGDDTDTDNDNNTPTPASPLSNIIDPPTEPLVQSQANLIAVSEADALNALDHNVDRIVRILELFPQFPFPAPPPDPTQQFTEAFARVEALDDGLTVDEKASLVVYLTEKPNAIPAYLALKTKEIRTRVIRKWLAQS